MPTDTIGWQFDKKGDNMCTSQIYRVYDFRTEKYTIQKGARLEHLPHAIIQPIPCGHCAECKMQHAQEWAFRCMKEAEQYENNVMVTLTYNDENVPHNYAVDLKTGEILKDVLTLNKRDVQLFIKRLRKHYGENVRYYMAGEYGAEFGRPHYHIIFFNLKVDDMRPYNYSKCEWSKEKNVLYKSKTFDKLWNKGFVDLNEVNYETCCYVARYVMKKWTGAGAKDHYEETGQVPEYNCMSRRPGIGYNYYLKNKEKFENEEVFWQKTKKGLVEFKPGRYFDKQIEKENPEILEALKEKRKNKSADYWSRLLAKTGLTKEEYIANRVSKVDNKKRFLKRTLV